MKKVLIVCSALFLGSIFSSQAQVTTSAGFKVQANYSKFRLSGMDGTSAKYGLGAGVGGFLKVEFGEYFAIQPELLFNLNRGKLKDEGSAKYRYLGLEIPVYAMGQFDTGNGKIFIGAGPYASYGLSSKLKNGESVNMYKKQEGANKAPMSRFDFGAGAILGYEFAGGFIVNGGYQMGFRNLLQDGQGAKMKNSSFNLGIGFKF